MEVPSVLTTPKVTKPDLSERSHIFLPQNAQLFTLWYIIHLWETQAQRFSTFRIWQFHIKVICHKSAQVWLIRLRCIKTPLYVASMVFATCSVDTDSVFVVTLTSFEVYNLGCCAVLCCGCTNVYFVWGWREVSPHPSSSFLLSSVNCRRPVAISSNESQNFEG